MDKNKDKFFNYEPIKISEIPTIELYMDQVLSFLYDRIKDFKSCENDKIMTKTMVNNYVKSKLIDLPVKKKYSIEHIKNLIMIYHFKNVISIKEINMLFQFSKQHKSEVDLYKTFYEIQKEELDFFKNNISEKENLCNNSIESILRNIIKADIHSRLAEKLLNQVIVR